jgi:hypothetical protein
LLVWGVARAAGQPPGGGACWFGAWRVPRVSPPVGGLVGLGRGACRGSAPRWGARVCDSEIDNLTEVELLDFTYRGDRAAIRVR